MKIGTARDAHLNPTLCVGANVHYEIQNFLSQEALMLDHRRFDEWLTLLSNDVVYRMPAGFAREVGMAAPAGVDHIEDDRRAICARIKGLQGPSALHASAPQMLTRTRRLITNVIVSPCPMEMYNVVSYVLLTLSKPGESRCQLLSAERHDLICKSARSFKIRARQIVMDQSNVNVDIDMYL